MIRHLNLWLRRQAWPTYDCELCVGQDRWQGCYCDYHGAVEPCGGPRRRHRFLRWLHGVLFPPKPLPDGPDL